MLMVSYCKLGLACTYKGGANDDLPEAPLLKKLFRMGLVVPVCPEVFGGLPTPRDPSEIAGGNGFDVACGKARVLSDRGADVTRNFLAGARMCAGMAAKFGVRAAVLKEFSPSCGVKFVYDGAFSKRTVAGPGVLGAVLLTEYMAGLPIFGEITREDSRVILNIFDIRQDLW